MTLTVERDVAPAPDEKVTPLLPSEAIKLGRLIAPYRIRGHLVSIAGRGEIYACSLGAMALGYGVKPQSLVGKYGWWPIGAKALTQRRLPLLCECNGQGVLINPMHLIMHTHDAHIEGIQEPHISEQQLIDHLAKYGL